MVKKIFIATEDFPLASRLLKERLSEDYEIITLDPKIDIKEQVKDVEVIIPAMEDINEEIIDSAKDLKLIVQFGVGLEGVDIESAEERGIEVRNVPGKNAESVAEASLFLMLSLAKKLNQLQKTFEQGRIGTPIGNELCDKNLCIVGLGASGSRLAEIANGVSMNCKGVRKHPKKGGPDCLEEIVSPDDMDRLLRWADYVALHLPLTEETEGMFDKEKFEKMKDSAYIVNVSRGKIIVKDDLYNALINEQIAGTGLDVYWQEPTDPNDELYSLENVVSTPHVAGVTEEAYERVAEEVVNIIEGMLE